MPDLPEMTTAGNADKARAAALTAGHRQRLFDRVLKHGLDSLQDYEVLECLLTVIPRRDVKPLAKELLNHFGSIANVLDAEPDELMEQGLTSRTAAYFKFARQLVSRYLEDKAVAAPILPDSRACIEFLRSKLGGLKKETLQVLLLDKRRKLKSYAEYPGTVDQTPVFPRELAELALRAHASMVLLAHNHPSGDCSPSPEDSDLTRRLREAFAIFGINLVDHIIVCRNDWRSLMH